MYIFMKNNAFVLIRRKFDNTSPFPSNIHSLGVQKLLTTCGTTRA